jgi:hypothetical protein
MTLTHIAHDGTRWTALWNGAAVHTPPCAADDTEPRGFLVDTAKEVDGMVADGLPIRLEGLSVVATQDDGTAFRMDMTYTPGAKTKDSLLGREGPRGWLFHLPHKTQPYVQFSWVWAALPAGLKAYAKSLVADYFLVDTDLNAGVVGMDFRNGGTYATSSNTLKTTAPGKGPTGAKKFKSESDALGYVSTLLGVRTVWGWLGLAPKWLSFDEAPDFLINSFPVDLPSGLAVVRRNPGEKTWTIVTPPDTVRAHVDRANRAWRVLNLYGHAGRALADKLEGKPYAEGAFVRVFQAGSGLWKTPLLAGVDEVKLLKAALKPWAKKPVASYASKSGYFFQVAALGTEAEHAELEAALVAVVGKGNVRHTSAPVGDRLLDTVDPDWLPDLAERGARYNRYMR